MMRLFVFIVFEEKFTLIHVVPLPRFPTIVQVMLLWLIKTTGCHGNRKLPVIMLSCVSVTKSDGLATHVNRMKCENVSLPTFV